ncbi:MAG: hypothetical protein AB8B94_12215 [Hyphomicrobiales bacterium]
MDSIMRYFLCFLLCLFIVDLSAFADSVSSKHASPQDMGQDFEDSPPVCYPASNNAWKDQHPDGENKGVFFGTKATCSKITKKLGVSYYATGGGITQSRDAERKWVGPEWSPIQVQPDVAGLGPKPIEDWKCVFARLDSKIPESEFTCTVSCCQFEVFPVVPK